MGVAVATGAAAESGFRSREELREVLERLLERVDADERLGPILRAGQVRTRFEFSDLGLDLNVSSAGGDDHEHSLAWSFAVRPPWKPKLILRMSSAVANRWLQGAESLAIAIARGRVRYSGEARSALVFVPVVKLLNEPYRRLVEDEYAHLRIRH